MTLSGSPFAVLGVPVDVAAVRAWLLGGALRDAEPPRPRPGQRLGGTLTDAEGQLVRLVAEGLTNRQIASALHYSPKTIEVYLSRVYAKTGCASRIELIRALDSGALELAV